MPPCVFAYVCLCSLASSPSFSIPTAASLIYALHHFCLVYLNIPVLSKFCVRCHLWPPYDLSTLCVCSSGERPFCCQLCPYRASQKGNLKTHVQSVHHMPFDNSQYQDRRSLLLSQGERGGPAAKHPPNPQEQQ